MHAQPKQAQSWAIGIDIGGTGVKAALVNVATGDLASARTRLRTPTPSTPEAGGATVRQVVDTIKVADETGNVAYDPTLRLAYVTARTPERLAIIDHGRRPGLDR